MIETRGFKLFRVVGLTLLTLFVALPVYIIVATSMKPLEDVRGTFEWWPSRITLEPYVEMWATIPLFDYFINSLVVSVIATSVSVAIAVIAAYALARMRFRGQRLFGMVILSTQMFPGILFLLPLFLIFVQLKSWTGVQFTGSYTGLIITYLTFALPFSIWMLTGYFRSIPFELEEAAMVDGTGRVGAMLRVILPVAKPGIIAVTVFAFNTAWGELLFASVLTNDKTRTLAVGLQQYLSEVDVFWNQLMAASLAVSLPLLIFFLMMQKHLVAGLAAGSVK